MKNILIILFIFVSTYNCSQISLDSVVVNKINMYRSSLSLDKLKYNKSNLKYRYSFNIVYVPNGCDLNDTIFKNRLGNMVIDKINKHKYFKTFTYSRNISKVYINYKIKESRINSYFNRYDLNFLISYE